MDLGQGLGPGIVAFISLTSIWGNSDFPGPFVGWPAGKGRKEINSPCPLKELTSVQPWAVEFSEVVETLYISTAQSGCVFMSPQEAGGTLCPKSEQLSGLSRNFDLGDSLSGGDFTLITFHI